MYGLSAYCNFISDKVRTDAYVEALRRTVTNDSVVLDIGAGTGFFAILACKLGARKAYAVEFNNAILLGREIAKANNVADRVEFIQNYSTNITLQEKADIAVFDLRGPTPLTDHNIPVVIDARERLLKPDSVFIPKRDSIKAALIEAFEDYEHDIIRTTNDRYDLRVDTPRKFLVNDFHFLKKDVKRLLTEPIEWAALDYASVSTTDFAKELIWEVDKEGTAHGVSLWFDIDLGNGCFYSTSPFAEEIVSLYNHPVLYFQSPVSVTIGDKVNINLQAKFISENYVWRWDTIIKNKHGEVKAKFHQSTLLSNILSPAGLKKQSSDFIPELNKDGQAELFVLTLMNENLSLGEIAKRLIENHKEKFSVWADAMQFVGTLAKKYSV